MYFRNISSRFFHLTRQNLATDKSALATLRKNTGYTFANCKKALEANQNDLAKAEAWLKEQAQAMGWSKAVKLEGRTTTQGLVGIVVKNNIGAMVEVNCETDFVARNEKFQQFVEQASVACVNYVSEIDVKDKIAKIGLESDALKNLKTNDGKNLGDSLALMIGTVGENASIKRAICYKAPESVSISACIHPSPDTFEEGKVFTGKYGAIAAFNSNTEKSEAIQSVHRKICQHIVGMKPKKIGNVEEDKPNEDKDEEKCLIFQEYILDPEMTIGEILKENNIKIIDFQRFECGEKSEDFGSENKQQ